MMWTAAPVIGTDGGRACGNYGCDSHNGSDYHRHK